MVTATLARTLVAATSIAAISLALTGCGSHDATVAAYVDPMSTAAAAATYQNVPSAEPTLLAPSALNGLVSMPWKLLSIHGSALTIVAAAGDGSCTIADGVNVTETSSKVTLGAYSRNLHAGACADPLQIARYTIELKQPLGDRSLVHLASDSSWKLG